MTDSEAVVIELRRLAGQVHRYTGAAHGFTAVFCDGEAAAELWCRHHPEPVCGDYTRRAGREYRRRYRSRARRRR